MPARPARYDAAPTSGQHRVLVESGPACVGGVYMYLCVQGVKMYSYGAHPSRPQKLTSKENKDTLYPPYLGYHDNVVLITFSLDHVNVVLITSSGDHIDVVLIIYAGYVFLITSSYL